MRRSDGGLCGAASPEDERPAALGLERPDDREAVGRRAQDAVAVDDERVDGAGARGDGVDLVAPLEHGLLVRGRDVRPGEAERHESADGIPERCRRGGQRDVRPVQPERCEPRVLQPW